MLLKKVLAGLEQIIENLQDKPTDMQTAILGGTAPERKMRSFENKISEIDRRLALFQ